MPRACRGGSGWGVWGVTGRGGPPGGTTCSRSPMKCRHRPTPLRTAIPAAPGRVGCGPSSRSARSSSSPVRGTCGSSRCPRRVPCARVWATGCGPRWGDWPPRASFRASATARDEDALATADASRADGAGAAARQVLAWELVGRLGPALGALPPAERELLRARARPLVRPQVPAAGLGDGRLDAATRAFRPWADNYLAENPPPGELDPRLARRQLAAVWLAASDQASGTGGQPPPEPDRLPATLLAGGPGPVPPTAARAGGAGPP